MSAHEPRDEIEDTRVLLDAQDLVRQYFDQEPQRPAIVPDRIGDFQVLEPIGRGGMGVVYAAEQGELQRRVALKVLHTSVTTTPHTRKRFEREARVTAQLHHTNIVTVHAMGREGDLLYFAMELVEGHPLDDVIMRLRELEAGEPGTRSIEGLTVKLRGPGSHKQIARVFADVADALDVAHSRGVIHRDLKPSNLILDGDGDLKLTDFGLARLVGEDLAMTLTGETIGTPLYMSPEQVRGEEVDARTDVYSLGATLYELLTLERMHRGEGFAAVCADILQGTPRRVRELMPAVPRDLATIVEKATAKDRRERYATADALCRDLLAFAESRPIAARPVGFLRRQWRRAKHHKVRSALVATAVAALLVAGVFAWRSDRERVEREREVALRRDREYEDLLARAVLRGIERKALLARAIAFDPARFEAYLERALREPQPTARALADLEAARERGLGARRYHLARSYVYYCGLQPGRGDQALAEAGPRGPDEATDDSLEGAIAYQRGELERADAICSRVIRSAERGSREQLWATLILAEIRERAGDYSRALEYLADLGEADERPVGVELHMLCLWDRMGQRKTAERRLASMLAAMGNALPGEWSGLLRVAEEHAPADWIVRIADAGLAQHPKLPALHYWRAMGLKRTNRPAEAMAAIDAAIALARDRPSRRWAHLRHMKSKVSYDLGRLEEALEEGRAAAELLPTTSGPQVTYALALLRAGRAQEAVAYAEQGVRCAPQQAWTHEMLGAARRALGDLDGASEAFEQGCAVEPSNGDMWLRLADVHTARDDLDAALEALRRAAQHLPFDPRLLARKCDLLKAAGRIEEASAAAKAALERADKLLGSAPSLSRLHVLRASALDVLGDQEGALRAYDAALALDPKDDNAWFNKGTIELDMGRLDDAETALQRALDLNPAYAPTWANLASLHLQREQYAEAIAACEKSLAHIPDAEVAHAALYNLGVCHNALDRPEEAEGALQRALEFKPGDADCWSEIGDARVKRGDWPAALTAYDKALQANPKLSWPWWQKAFHLNAQKRPDEALRVVDEARTHLPDDANLLKMKAVLLFHQGRLRETLPLYGRLVTREPDNAGHWRARGGVHLRMGAYADAEADYDRAIELDDQNAGAFQARSVIRSRRGKHKEALADVEQGLELAPAHPVLLNSLAWTLAVCPDASVRDPARATGLIDRALRAAPEQPALWNTAGWVRLMAERPPEEAIAAFGRCIELKGGEPGVADHAGLSLAWLRRGKSGRARSELAKAEAALPKDPAQAAAYADCMQIAREAMRNAEKVAK